MHPQVQRHAAEIRSLVRDCEAKSDALIQAQAALRSKILEARQHASVPQGAGQDVLNIIAKIDQRSISNGNDFFRAHNRMSDMYIALGGPDEDIITEKVAIAPQESETV
jgi:hypothetical protein